MAMTNSDHMELLKTAEEHFNQGRYPAAESILNQLILNSCREPLLFHMLGTIYYDQGKFNKAIRAFKRALEIDPAFTDASVGLSIILNDLGKYEDGKKVFEDAKAILARNSKDSDPYINEKLSIKHDELGELYFQYKRFNEALEQFFKALKLSGQKRETVMKIVECYIKLEATPKAIKELKELIQSCPDFYPARMKLGKVFYDDGKIQLARKEWQDLLTLNPEHSEARKLIKQLDSSSIEIESNMSVSP